MPASFFGDINQNYYFVKKSSFKEDLNVKRFQKILIIFLSSISFVFAQNGRILSLNLEESVSNTKPELIKAQIQIAAASSDGIFIELPQGLTAVVRSAALDGNTLWLLNGDKAIDKKNVLGWQLKDNGILLHYSNDFAGQLDLEIAPDSARLNSFDQIDINIHQVTRNNSQLNVNNTVVAQSNLKIKPNTQTDEE
jgi:hypothetical protein